MLITEQSFAGGLSTVYITTWGLSSATVGVVVSESDLDDGDCPDMMAEHAKPSSPRFEGLTLLSAATHTAYLTSSPVRDPAAACLRDGSCIVATLDWDLHRLVVFLHHKGAQGPVEVAALSALPSRPVRIALGAVARPSGGDVDGIATVNSKPPAYLVTRK
jgi:hypothetical protein